VGWERESAQAVPSKLADYSDMVLIAGAEEKEVSSSQAHLQVMSSPLWTGRTDRVARRLTELKQAIASGDGSKVSEIAWAELWEMHSLFHTAEKPFTYWLPESVEILRWVQKQSRGELIATMDAGPNVHLLVPTARRDEWVRKITQAFPKIELLIDQQGRGASIL
jgi:diphosphomevalonate decarboxylase